MTTDPAVRHVAVSTEGSALLTVNFHTLGEEFVDLIAEDVVDFFVLRRDAAVEHGTSTGLANDVFAAVSAPDRLAHATSIDGDSSPVPHSIMGHKVPVLCLSCAPSTPAQL